MAFCLPKINTDKFIQALKDGTIQPEKLFDMTSMERRTFFEDIVGREHAQEVNALFESKLLLKDQKRGLVSWAKKVSGISEPVRRDMISKIENMKEILTPQNEKAFLSDLVSKKLGTDVTLEEAGNIAKGSKQLAEAKDMIPSDSPTGSRERLNYGFRYVLFQDYVSGLKGRGKFIPFREMITSPLEVLNTIAGTAKSLLSTLDNSFFGRQGIKMLFTNPSIWGKAFIKSWGDIGRELVGIDAITPIKADIFSRPNALNGKYNTMKLDIGLLSEEAFPSSLPEKIPILGRVFKGAESAFNGAALRMRADYADKLIIKAEEFGKNMNDATDARGVGEMINSMTGRGTGLITPKTPRGQRIVNANIFSIKFLQSNLNTLTAHLLDRRANNFVKREAAMNLAKIIAVEAAIHFTASRLQPGSTESDPRGTGFGKIRIGATTFDTTGGMGSIITLASRITPTVHDGKWGFWSKNSITGKYTDLTSGKYGQRDVMDVINNFWEGKLAPLSGLLRDVWKGKDFQGDKPTLISGGLGLITPISLQTLQDLLNNPDSAPVVGSMILDGLGISTYTPPKKK